MAVKVGELYARLTLNDAEFNRKLDAAEKKSKDVAKAASAAFVALAGSITAAAVAASNYVGEAVAIANQTGLAVEAVEALGYAARRSDADLGLLSTGLRALVRRAAEASQGNQAFLAYFEQLGISAERLAELLHDPERLITDVADAMARLPTEAHASAAAMNVMGDSGRRLVPFMRQGGSEIRALMRDAERLGLVMGQRAIRDLNAFGDEWGTLAERAAAVSRVLAVEFLPTIRAVMDGIDGAIDSVQSLDEGTRRLIGTIGSGAIGAVGSFAAITTAIWGATRAMQALGTVFKLASGPAGWIALAATGLVSVYTGLATAKRHADALRTSIIQFGTLDDVERELESVRSDLEAKRAQLERYEQRADPSGSAALYGMTGSGRLGALLVNEQLKKDIENLEEAERELVGRVQEIRDEMAQAVEEAPIIIPVEIEAPEESEAFAAWRAAIEEAQDKLQRETEIIRFEDPRTKDRPFAERELQEELRKQRDYLVAARQVTFQTLINDTSLLEEEVAELNQYLEHTGVLLDNLTKFDLKWASDAVQAAYKEASLGLRLDQLEGYEKEMEVFRLMFETGRIEAGNLLVKMAEIEEALAKLGQLSVFGEVDSDAYMRLMQAQIAARRFREQVEGSIPPSAAPLAPVHLPPAMSVPEVLSAEERIRTLMAKLVLDVEVGTKPLEDAVAQIRLLQRELLGVMDGSLVYATEEQKRLWMDLADTVERFTERLQVVPTRLDQIRADYERAMGVGMAVERELAFATGGEFDAVAYQMSVLEQTIQALVIEEGALTAEVEEHLRVLRQLSREQEIRLYHEQLYNTAIQSALRQMGDLGRAFEGAVSFAPGVGFGFDVERLALNAVGLIADTLFGLFFDMSGSAEVLERAAESLKEASAAWDRTLAEGQFHEMVAADPTGTIAEYKRIRREIQNEMQIIERWGVMPWERATYDSLKTKLNEVNKAIQELEETALDQLEGSLNRVLGVGTRDLQGAVSSAFGASTIEDFTDQMEASLTNKVRNAFVTAFLESEMMAPLFEGMGDAIREAVMDSEITPGEIDGIREIMEQIRTGSEPFWELLSEFGLLADTTERVNQQFGRLLNVPIGFRALQALRYTSATPQVVSAMAGAQSAGGGDTYIHIERLEARDYDDFTRKMKRYESREGLRNAGNPTGRRWSR